jgi:hypothetical protein
MVSRSPKGPNQHDYSKAAISPARSPAAPYLSRVFPPFFLGRVVDHGAAGVVRASGVLKRGLGVLGEIAGSGVELAGAATNPGPCHREPKAGVAAFAEPSQIVRITVGFVAVAVIDDEKTTGPAQGTLGRSGRAARGMLSPVSFRPVTDLGYWLSPGCAALACGLGQSWS